MFSFPSFNDYMLNLAPKQQRKKQEITKFILSHPTLAMFVLRYFGDSVAQVGVHTNDRIGGGALPTLIVAHLTERTRPNSQFPLPFFPYPSTRSSLRALELEPAHKVCADKVYYDATYDYTKKCDDSSLC